MAEQQDMRTDGEKITDEGVIALEKASRLRLPTMFEEGVLADRAMAFKKFGRNTRLTEKQFKVIQDMAHRYDVAVGIAALSDWLDQLVGELRDLDVRG